MITPYDHSPLILTHYATKKKNARMAAGILFLLKAIVLKHNDRQQEITSCP